MEGIIIKSCIQAWIHFNDTAARDTIKAELDLYMSDKSRWGVTRNDPIITSPHGADDVTVYPSLHIEARFNSAGHRDTMVNHALDYIRTTYIDSIVVWRIQQHECPHDEASRSPCAITSWIEADTKTASGKAWNERSGP